MKGLKSREKNCVEQHVWETKGHCTLFFIFYSAYQIIHLYCVYCGQNEPLKRYFITFSRNESFKDVIDCKVDMKLSV